MFFWVDGRTAIAAEMAAKREISIHALAARAKSLTGATDVLISLTPAELPSAFASAQSHIVIADGSGVTVGAILLYGIHLDALSAEKREFLGMLATQFGIQAELHSELRHQEERNAFLQAMIHASLDGVFLLSGEGTILGFNQKLLEISRLSLDQVRGKNLLELADLIEPLMKNPREFFASLASIESREVVASEIPLRDGRYLQRHSAPLIQPGTDRQMGRALFFRDITEQKRNEVSTVRALRGERFATAQVREQMRRTHELFAQVPALAAILKGSQHIVEFANSKYEELVGGATLVGRPLPEAIPDLDESARKLMDQVFTSGERYIGHEVPMKARWMGSPEITQRYFTFIYEPTRDLNGQVDGIWILGFDVSHGKNLELQLEFSERLATLGTLAAGTAHEINNPLTFILSSLEQMGEALAGESRVGDDRSLLRTQHRSISEGVQRIRRIVRDLKDFSRVKPDGDAPCDVNRVLNMAIAMAAPEFRGRIDLIKDLGEIGTVIANSSRLEQVFLNLLINAAHACHDIPRDHHSITVQSRLSAVEGGKFIEVNIRDTGKGMEPSVLARVFDPFFTTKPFGVGTGLGLSVCHGIVASVGGQIEVESQPEVGTGFTVRLPVSAAASSDSLPTFTKKSGTPGAPRSRIMIVDDEVEIGEVLQTFLSRDHDVEIFTDARKALAHLSQLPFDTIICDLMMPGFTGTQFYSEVKRLRPELAASIVFTSGGIFSRDVETFVRETGNALLEKPFTRQELLSHLKKPKPNGKV